MKISARTVMFSWTSGMGTRFAPYASMTRAREGGKRVYASGGSGLTSILSYKGYATSSSGASKPPLSRHWATIVGSSVRWNRRASSSLL
jgi:hypothetical protein